MSSEQERSCLLLFSLVFQYMSDVCSVTVSAKWERIGMFFSVFVLVFWCFGINKTVIFIFLTKRENTELAKPLGSCWCGQRLVRETVCGWWPPNVCRYCNVLQAGRYPTRRQNTTILYCATASTDTLHSYYTTVQISNQNGFPNLDPYLDSHSPCCRLTPYMYCNHNALMHCHPFSFTLHL